MIQVKKIETNLKDCYIIKPDVYGDDRGYFCPFYKLEDLKELGINFDGVVQANRSKSSKGVLRGLHFQADPKCQAKLVEVVSGSAIDVVVDIRDGSPTYGKYTSVLLKPYDSKDPESGNQLFVPRGFAHGFISLEDDTIFQYLIDNDFSHEHEGGILWNDPELGIPWDKMFEDNDITEPLLSDKDQIHPTLSKNSIHFKYNGGK